MFKITEKCEVEGMERDKKEIEQERMIVVTCYYASVYVHGTSVLSARLHYYC